MTNEMPADTSEPSVVSVARDSPFQVSYVMSDKTSSALRCTPAFADFVVEAWAARNSSSQINIEKVLKELRELIQLILRAI